MHVTEVNAGYNEAQKSYLLSVFVIVCIFGLDRSHSARVGYSYPPRKEKMRENVSSHVESDFFFLFHLPNLTEALDSIHGIPGVVMLKKSHLITGAAPEMPP